MKEGATRDTPFYAIGAAGRAAVAQRPGPPVGQRPDAVLNTAEFGGLEIRAASVRGLLHYATETARQDAYVVGRGTDDTVIVAVCDGVGSLRHSAVAADLASAGLVTELTAGRSHREAFAVVNTTLEYEAAAQMATTAVALTARRHDHGWTGTVSWVGDSTAWHLTGSGDWVELTAPDENLLNEADVHDGSTSALPQAELEVRVRDFEVTGGALFLMSDGVGRPLALSPSVQESLADWWQEPPELFTFAAQVNFARRTHVDDRTVVGLWPAVGGPS